MGNIISCPQYHIYLSVSLPQQTTVREISLTTAQVTDADTT